MDSANFAPKGALAKLVNPTEPLPVKRRSFEGQDPLNTHFPSVAAMGNWLSGLGIGSKYYVAIDRDSRGMDWTWEHNTAQAMALIKSGWVGGSEHVKTAHVDVANTYLAEHSEESTRHDVTGAFVDVAAFLDGTPECMVDFCQEKRETRAVRIIVDSSVSGGVSADVIFNRGIAIMGAVLAVQASGVAVTLDLSTDARVYTSGHGARGERIQFGVTLFRPGEAFDTSRLVYYLAHPAFMRLVVIGGAKYALAGATNGRPGDGKKVTKPGEVWIEDMMLNRHPWGSAEANKILIEKIFNAAV